MKNAEAPMNYAPARQTDSYLRVLIKDLDFCILSRLYNECDAERGGKRAIGMLSLAVIMFWEY